MGPMGGLWRLRGQSGALLGIAVWLVLAQAVGALDAPQPGDDATYRPTVMIRKGTSLGSGTIISSVEDETLILTASHVVEGPGPLHVELFRFNVGLERTRNASGFPRKIAATVAARDIDADLAILRVRGQLAFPYVARLGQGEVPPPTGTPVTTIGFDKGEQIIGFSTKIKSVERIDMDRGGGDRPFLITEHPPEHGRSGGGLFRNDGALVGVCVGRIELLKGRKIGLFTSLTNVKALIRAHDDIVGSLSRSNVRTRSAAR